MIFHEKFRKQMDLQLHLFILLIFWFFIFLSSNLFFLDQTKYSLQNPGASQTANSPKWLHDQSCQAGQSAQSRKDSFLEPETTNTQVGCFPTVSLPCLASQCLLKSQKSLEALCLSAFCWKAKRWVILPLHQQNFTALLTSLTWRSALIFNILSVAF